jgi:hypothetical protein
MRRAIDATLRRIDGSCRVIDASERFSERRPVHAMWQLNRAAAWLADASVQLERAGFRLKDTMDCLAGAPEEGRGAPARILRETLRSVEAVGELTAVAAHLDAVAARVLQRVLEAHGVDERPVIAAPRPAVPHWFLQYCPPLPADRIRLLLQRRRRPAQAVPTDAPRRVSRGRAPPFVSTCLL